LSVCIVSYTSAQEVSADTVKKTRIYLEHADVRSFNKKIDDQRQVLNGNVVFRHDSSYMYCDSAYFYERDLSLEAFSRVRLEQGDTLFVYGDYLFYDGNIELAQMRHNVRMVNIQPDSSAVTLYTDSLDYNRQTDLCYYFEGGRIIDAENDLTSIDGQYSPGTKIAVFEDSVCLTNPNFVLYSDTLEYSTETKIATILGPSVIESDSGIIHSSRGWYNTENNTSLLLDRSHVFSGEKTLVGDSLVYDKTEGIGKAFGNMSLRDTAQQTTLTGHYGYYEEKTEYAFATDSACALEYSQGEDTLFLHADTLELITVDSTSHILRAIKGVRFFRSDIQGICDLMRFNTKDSALYMYGSPVLWNEDQQLFGDSIIIYMANSAIDYVHVPTSAFSVQRIDTGHYNQLGGNDLKAYFNGKMLEHVDIDGNAESIYYPIENNGTIEMLIYMKSSYLSFWMNEEGKLEKMKYQTKPSGRVLPIPDLSNEDKTLKKFAWYGDLRPVDKNDIFRFYKKKELPVAAPPTGADSLAFVRDSSWISDTLRLPADTALRLPADTVLRIEPPVERIDSLIGKPVADTLIKFEDRLVSRLRGDGRICAERQPLCDKPVDGRLFRVANHVNRRTPVFGRPDFRKHQNKQKRI
jgi:lipopolysaccharide export system protein LptA